MEWGSMMSRTKVTLTFFGVQLLEVLYMSLHLLAFVSDHFPAGVLWQTSCSVLGLALAGFPVCYSDVPVAALVWMLSSSCCLYALAHCLAVCCTLLLVLWVSEKSVGAHIQQGTFHLMTRVISLNLASNQLQFLEVFLLKVHTLFSGCSPDLKVIPSLRVWI